MARQGATAAARAAPRRRAPARRPPRRVSGSIAGSGAVALPGRVLRAPFARAARARAGGVLDALLQGRAWIALVAVLLVGIVFFNVDLLELNRNIASTADKAAKMKRENANLRLQLARLASSERIQRAAVRRGLELPSPGDVRYLRLHPGVDARKAARSITAPGEGTATPVAAGTPAPAPPSTPATPANPPAAQAPQSTGTQTAPTPTTTTPSSPPATPPPAAGSPTGGAAPAPTAPSTGTGG
jgi:cell division protein FtsL